MINILRLIRQENKDSSPLSFGSRQYLPMQSYHTVKVALKNMKTQKIVKSLDAVGDGSPWSESSSGWDRYRLYIVLYRKEK